MRTENSGSGSFLPKSTIPDAAGAKWVDTEKWEGIFRHTAYKDVLHFQASAKITIGGGETGVQRKNIRLYQLDWSAAQSPLALTPRGAACMYFMDVRKGHSPLRTRAANLNLQSGDCRNYIFTLDWCTRTVEWMIPFICGPYYHFNAELSDFGTVKL